MSPNPAAYFDALVLADRMTDIVDGFSRPELHLFSYAACLLSLYDGQPVAEWGYDFVSTDNGLPFSQDIDAVIDVGLSLGLFHADKSLITLSSGGADELRCLREFESNRARDLYLDGAADSLLVFNPGNIREAFNHDPDISYLRKEHRTDWLLTSVLVDRLYSNFDQLRKALPYDARDLSVPLITWLRYLIQTGRSENYGLSAS